ncbi:hypothetical protein [Amycolatopsis suaedae]|uniref:Uncharacterized protein n=1 Tax=Amycolatopsis suaedae TaxID=2510978 RepID=A0A4Q7JDT0_9PSEU|nr:hypothetical protein [Amycolatopsis suaedae]RZQ65232.1 hypothetical protein EWH70_04910 [Amycolatopsis suaedae]
MNQAEDPERLLAEALRAQARSAPPGEQPSAPPPVGYGLLSGTGADSLERARAQLEETEPPTVRADAQPGATTRQITPARPLPAHWVLLLAVLLGLASGTVVGLLTLL